MGVYILCTNICSTLEYFQSSICADTHLQALESGSEHLMTICMSSTNKIQKHGSREFAPLTAEGTIDVHLAKFKFSRILKFNLCWGIGQNWEMIFMNL